MLVKAKKIIFSSLTGLMILTVSFFCFNLNLVRAAGNARVYFSPVAASARIGSSFTINIMVNPNGEEIDTVRAAVSFPADKLKAIAFSLGSLYPEAAPVNSIDNAAGLLSQGGAVYNDSVSSAGVFGTITFKALAAGEATVSATADSRLIRSGAEKINLTNLGSAAVTILAAAAPLQCADGLDNDGDGLIDLNDPGCENAEDNNETDDEPDYAQCADSVDNDGDGLTDLDDPGCADAGDDDETDEVEPAQCNDGVDNDGDGLIDLSDPGCINVEDDNETDVQPVYQCHDGADNDQDGKIDFPADPGCSSLTDNDETDAALPIFQCNDGADNDGDGKIDLNDPGCSGATDNDEADVLIRPAVYQCNDGADNDNDGLIDLADPGCANDMDNIELDDEAVGLIEEKDEWTKTEEDIDIEIESKTDQLVRSGAISRTTDAAAQILSNVSGLNIDQAMEQVEQTVRAVAKATVQVQKATFDNPVAEKVNEKIKKPAMAAVAATSVAAVATAGATSASGASVFALLQFLFTQPLVLFSRRKQRGWGVIYDSITNRPIDLAVARVYLAATKKLVRTAVTDKYGRYKFLLKPGRYYITVNKKEFKFPATLIKKEEAPAGDESQQPYLGGEFEITEKSAMLRPIPLDPDRKVKTEKSLIRLNWLRKGQAIMTIVGPALALVSFAINPKAWVGGLVVLQLVLYLFFRRLAIGKKPKTWGVVRDGNSKKNLSQSVVRVFDAKFNKLLETQVTDRKGRYAFLVGDKEYYVVGEKGGYFPRRSQRYNLQGKESGYLAEDLHLYKLGSKEAAKAQKSGRTIFGWRNNLGRQKEAEIDGIKKTVRKEGERFKGKIKGVDLNKMHEDYYNVDYIGQGKQVQGVTKPEPESIPVEDESAVEPNGIDPELIPDHPVEPVIRPSDRIEIRPVKNSDGIESELIPAPPIIEDDYLAEPDFSEEGKKIIESSENLTEDEGNKDNKRL